MPIVARAVFRAHRHAGLADIVGVGRRPACFVGGHRAQFRRRRAVAVPSHRASAHAQAVDVLLACPDDGVGVVDGVGLCSRYFPGRRPPAAANLVPGGDGWMAGEIGPQGFLIQCSFGHSGRLRFGPARPPPNPNSHRDQTRDYTGSINQQVIGIEPVEAETPQPLH